MLTFAKTIENLLTTNIVIMEIIYHPRRINFHATIKSFEPGDEYIFSGLSDSANVRVLCSKLPGKFTVNKLKEGLKVTRLA